MSDLSATHAKESFLTRNNVDVVPVKELAQDSSARIYHRHLRDGKPLLLMLSPPDDSPASLPGHKTKDFVELSRFLRQKGIRTPEIYAEDHANGFILLEDFGDTTFKLKSAETPDKCYAVATGVLANMRNNIQSEELQALPDYYKSPVHTGRRRIVDWYVPALYGEQHPEDMVASYLSVWDEIEAPLPSCRTGFCHIDFHFENLLWDNNAEGTNRCGVIDFQGAMRGPCVYDVANLLEDARLIVPGHIKRTMWDEYCASETSENRELLEIWFRIIATQFHCRVVGQFIKIALVLDKPEYLSYIPNVMHYLNQAADHPALQPLYRWFKEHHIIFDDTMTFDLETIRKNIRPDAF